MSRLKLIAEFVEGGDSRRTPHWVGWTMTKAHQDRLDFQSHAGLGYI